MVEFIKNRLSNAYIDEVENFLDYAFTKWEKPSWYVVHVSNVVMQLLDHVGSLGNI